MDRDAIVATIRSEEAALEQVGVKALALVGSSARGDRGADSDVDVLIDVADAAGFSSMDRIAIMHLPGDAPGVSVDVSRRDTLNANVRDRMVRDAIKVF